MHVCTQYTCVGVGDNLRGEAPLRDNMGRYHCGHCNQVLSKTEFHQHKRLYYDSRLKKWSFSRVNYSELEADKTLGSSSTAFTISSSESEIEDGGPPIELQEPDRFSPGAPDILSCEGIQYQLRIVLCCAFIFLTQRNL